jgi:hypothetical protein
MDKVQVLTTCRACGGQAYLLTSEEMSANGRKYFRHLPCTACQGSGKEARWIDLQDFAKLLDAVAAEKSKA